MNRAFLLASILLAGCSRGAPDIAVTDAWARETRSGETAAYLTIANRGSAADRLIAVTVPPPASASLHETRYEDGIARMRSLTGGLEVAAGQSVRLAPAGVHVMVTGLNSPLAPGDTLPLTLRFERSGERQVAAQVRAALAPHEE